MRRESIKNLIHSYFGFNRQQRNGVAVLSAICFLLLLLRLIYPHFIKPGNIIVADLPLVLRNADVLKNEKTHAAAQRFMFDPNQVSLQQLLDLGFSKRTASTLIKFRNKGFVFKRKEDLRKVYGVSDQMYTDLQQYILINAPKKITSPKSAAILKDKLELNSADSLQLLELRGVGPSFAKRILKYRSILGGYVSVSQLKEVYGFTDEMYAEIEPQVKVNPALITKININTDDFKAINKHPYITYELTKLIFEKKRRELITPEVLQSLVNDDITFKKLEPYVNY